VPGYVGRPQSEQSDDRPPSEQAPPPPVDKNKDKLATSSSSGIGASGMSSSPKSPGYNGMNNLLC